MCCPVRSLTTESILLNSKIRSDETKSVFGSTLKITTPRVSLPSSWDWRKDLKSIRLQSSALLDVKSKFSKWCKLPIQCHSGRLWWDSLIKTLWIHCSTSQVLAVLKERWYRLLHLQYVGTMLAAECTRDTCVPVNELRIKCIHSWTKQLFLQ